MLIDLKAISSDSLTQKKTFSMRFLQCTKLQNLFIYKKNLIKERKTFKKSKAVSFPKVGIAECQIVNWASFWNYWFSLWAKPRSLTHPHCVQNTLVLRNVRRWTFQRRNLGQAALAGCRYTTYNEKWNCLGIYSLDSNINTSN